MRVKHKSPNSKPAAGKYEPVLTVRDYWDGPRKGIAHFDGKPHFFECVFDEARDEYTNLFQLTPISPETLKIAMEAWKIWLEWEMAFRKGRVNISTHPSYSGGPSKNRSLISKAEKLLVTDPSIAATRIGKFKFQGSRHIEQAVPGSFKVKWSPPTRCRERMRRGAG
jgi:hypothetical protein